MFAGLHCKHTCSRDTPHSLIRHFSTKWFKAWICCLKLYQSVRIGSPAAFSGTSLTHFLFLLQCLWDIDITWVILGTGGGWAGGGSPLRVVFPPYRRGHTDPFLLCDRRLFPEQITWHDNRHACTSLLKPPPSCSLCINSQTGAKLQALGCV